MPPSKDAAAPRQKMLTISFAKAKDAKGLLILDHICTVA